MVTRKTQYRWMATGGMLCLFAVVFACKVRDGNKANAQADPLPGLDAVAGAAAVTAPKETTGALKPAGDPAKPLPPIAGDPPTKPTALPGPDAPGSAPPPMPAEPPPPPSGPRPNAPDQGGVMPVNFLPGSAPTETASAKKPAPDKRPKDEP